MKTAALISFVLLFCTFSSFSQKVKFGKINKEDLSRTSCKYDSTANAEYLYHSSKIEFEYNETYQRFDLVYYIHDRIKIFNQDGISNANIEIPYYVGGNNTDQEIISKLKAITFNLKAGKIVQTKLENKNVYVEEKNKNWSIRKFAMPAVKAGSIIDVKYKFTSPRIFSVNEFYMQKDLPIAQANFEAAVPEYFNYNINKKGFIPLNAIEERESRAFTLNVKEKLNIDNGRVLNKDTNKRTENINYNVDVKRFNLTNVKSLPDEPFVYTMDNYKSSIRMELLSTQYPGSKVKYYTNTWDNVAEQLNKSDRFGKVLNRNYNDFDELLKGLEAESDEDKLKAIFGHFQSNFKWDHFYSIYADRAVKKQIKAGVGNSALINLLLVNVLKRAGLVAYPLVYKPRTFGHLNTNNPTIYDLDYVIAVVQLEKGIMYLDATSKYTSPNMLPTWALNLNGVIMDGDKGLSMPIKNPNKSSNTNFYTLSIEDQNLVGTVQHRIKGFAAYQARVSNEKEELLIENLDNKNSAYENVTVKDFLNNKNSLAIDGNISISSGFKKIGNKIFIDLSLTDQSFENPFKAEERTFAIFYESTLKNNTIVKIAIPEGYMVESMPEKLLIASPEKQLKYLIEPKIQGDEIIVNIRETRTSSIINPSYYTSIQQFYDQVQLKLQEKIVLIKK